MKNAIYTEDSPLISIIMPSYNAQSFIAEAIESVIKQDYLYWELIIVDDNSSDDTREVITSFNESRIRLIKLPKNSGSPSTPRNIALSEAQGEFIAFLDADDIWHPNKLSMQINFMQEKQCQFSCTPYELFGKKSIEYYPPLQVSYDELLYNNSIGCSTVMIHSNLLKDIKFPQCGHEDFSLWLKVLKIYNNCLSMDSVLAKYRVTDGSVSSKKYKLIPFFWNIYRNEENFTIYKSIYCCFRYFINVVWVKYK